MRKLLLVAAALAFAWAGALYAFGGTEWRVGGVLIRSHDPLRALVLGAALFLVQAVIFRASVAREIQRAIEGGRRHASSVVLVAAVALAFVGIRFGTFIASGSDSYGYVSQAYGWADGELPRPTPAQLALPWASSDSLQAPLGYRAAPRDHAIVPTYAPGLPLVMAVALILGPCGPYLVVPAAGGMLVWFTYLWARRVAGPLAGLVAALVLITSPIILFQILWPMSDIPCAALWTGAAVASLGTTRKRAFATGVCSAAALLVRPNVALLVIPVVGQVLGGSHGRERWMRAAISAAPVGAVAILIAALNIAWYGAPWNSGYGAAEELYSLANIGPNLARYPVWLWQSHTGWVLAAFVPFLARRSDVAGIRLACLLIGATFLSYIAYFPFEDWWYLRFMLPAMGALAVLVATGIITIGRLVPILWGSAAALVITLAIALHGIIFSSSRGTFGGVGATERRYADAGVFVARALPDNAVVFTMQHSGSIRFYGGRFTIRYEFLSRDEGRNAPVALEQLGYHPFLLIDDWEAPILREHFGLAPETTLPWKLIARLNGPTGVSLFDLSANPSAAPPVDIESGSASLCVAPKRVILEPRPQ